MQLLPRESGEFIIEAGEYTLSQPLQLPVHSSPANAAFEPVHIKGYGATINVTGTGFAFQRVSATHAEALGHMQQMYIIEGVRFVGDGTGTAIQMAASYGTIIENCFFQNFGTAIDLIFCPKYRVISCAFSKCDVAVSIRSGRDVWAAATADNSASHHGRIETCRFFSLTGAAANIRIRHSDSTTIDGCIFEGGDPLVNIDYDPDGATHSLNVYVRHTWLENLPTVAHILTKGRGQIHLENTRMVEFGSILVDASAAASTAEIKIDGLTSVPEMPTFKHGDGVLWRFSNVWNTPNLSQPQYWAGEVPDGLSPVTPQNDFYPESYGAVGDGVADDTAAIQAAIDAASVGGGNVILTRSYALSVGGTYTFNAYYRDYGLIVLSSGVHLYGPGELLFNQAPITQTGNFVAVAVGNGTTPITNVGVHGLTIRDTADLSSAGLGGAIVAFFNCDGFVIESCHVATDWGNNIGINAAIFSRNGHILNNRVVGMPMSGIWCDGLINSLIDGNNVEDVALHGIAIAPNTDYFQAGYENRIVNNRINRFGHTGIALDGGNKQTIVANNQIYAEGRNNVVGVRISSSSNANGNWQSENNLITGNIIGGANLGGSFAFMLRGVDMGLFDGGPVLCEQNVITNNHVTPGFAYAGYLRQGVQNNIIVNNALGGRRIITQAGVTTAINNVMEPNY